MHVAISQTQEMSQMKQSSCVNDEVLDYWSTIASHFIMQLEDVMDRKRISFDALAHKVDVLPSVLEFVFEQPGNLWPALAIRLAMAVNMGISLVLYDQPNSKKHVGAEILTQCWERQGRPRNYIDLGGENEATKIHDNKGGG